MITPAERAEALAWVRAQIGIAERDGLHHAPELPGLVFAEAVLTRHAPDTRYPGERARLTCTGCYRRWPCPDVEPPLAFVKAVRG